MMTESSLLEFNWILTKGSNDVPTVVAVVILATVAATFLSYPPSEITVEQICFIEELEAVAPVLVISYLIGRVAVVI
jgi:hypothetical protein